MSQTGKVRFTISGLRVSDRFRDTVSRSMVTRVMVGTVGFRVSKVRFSAPSE